MKVASPQHISIIFLCAGIALAGISLLASRATRREKRAALAAAAIVCLLDFIVESFAARMGWWRLHGLWPVLMVPVVYPIGWVCFTFHFFLLFAAARRAIGRPSVVFAIFLCAGVCAGMVWNYFGSRYLGTLTFSKAHLSDVVWVWGFLVATGLGAWLAMTDRYR
jgi:hypothetical protein